MNDNVTENFNGTPGQDVIPAGKSPIINEQQQDIFIYVVSIFVGTAICVLGFFGNIINIIVFFKQGFKSTVNITLFGIAISDLGSVVSLLSAFVLYLFRNSDVPIVANEVYYLTAGLPHIFFSRVTSWFIALATVERCLSVTIPLKVKRVVTPKRTIIALVFIFILNFLSFVPEYLETNLDWKFVKERNKTLLGIVKQENIITVSFMMSPILGIIPMAIVTVSTVVLVIQLKRKSKWRKSATRSEHLSGQVSTREKNTMKIIIVLAIILIACNAPGVITTPATIVEPDFSVMGVYFRLFGCVWSFLTTLQVINSSVNIFFYYRMSSNYREAFNRLLPSCARSTQEE